MSVLKAQNIYFKYEDASEHILQKCNFQITPNSRIGLIGNNGCGKSTLLKLLTQELKPESGSIRFFNPPEIAWLQQELYSCSDESVELFLLGAFPLVKQLKQQLLEYELNSQLNDSQNYLENLSTYEELGGYDLENKLLPLLYRFEFSESILQRHFNSLSGGEKSRLAMAQIALKQASLLLLDEPTNHLDSNALQWLEKFLTRLQIPFVLISHDRYFLDQTVNQIWELKNGEIYNYSGNYSDYRRNKQNKFLAQKERFKLQQKKVKTLTKACQQRRTGAERNERFKESRSIKNNGGICKRDEGSGKAVRSGNGGRMRSAIVLERRVQKMLNEEQSKMPFVEKNNKFKFTITKLRCRQILEANDLAKCYDQHFALNTTSLMIANGEKVALVGKNGCGKSTLIKILANRLANFEGTYKWTSSAKIGYYAQEHDTLTTDNCAIDEVTQGQPEIEGQARVILGCLKLSADKVFQPIASLSAGEKCKVSLAKLMLSKANVLLLDEPTNHLELEARQAFEDALDDFNGTIILASHDRMLVNKIASRVIKMD